MKRSWAVAGLFILFGCFHDSAAPIRHDVHGRFLLRTIDGKPLPQLYTDVPNFRLEFMSGRIVLHEDGTFADSTELRRTENGLVRRVIDVAEGTFVEANDTVRLTSTRGERYFMVFATPTLTQNLGGRLLVYRR
jgi:hypothetical protein